MDKPPAGYLAYLLRLRYVDNARDPVWRLSLESPNRMLHVTFRGLDELVSFLQTQMGQIERPPSKEDDT
jgi:hypothetical protein